MQPVFIQFFSFIPPFCKYLLLISTPPAAPIAPPPIAAPKSAKPALVPGAENVILDPYAVGDHPLVVKILQGGWSSYFPLTHLTNENSRKALQALQINTSISSADSLSHLVRLYPTNRREDQLLPHEFLESSARLCDMVKHHFPSSDSHVVADSFCKHYQNLQQRPDFHDRFGLYLQYDIAIRKAWALQVGKFAPHMFQRDLWQSLLDRSALEQQLSLEHTIRSYSSGPSVPNRPSQLQQPAASAIAFSTSRGAPRGRPRGSFHSSSAPTSSTTCCFICGSPSHLVAIVTPQLMDSLLLRTVLCRCHYLLRIQWQGVPQRWLPPHPRLFPLWLYRALCTIPHFAMNSSQLLPPYFPIADTLFYHIINYLNTSMTFL
jgi:hypothetical protein